jgi:DNA helicase-2/ATP-dependent DNA helicase PcrA
VQNEPSRFIDEIPSQFLDRAFSGGGALNQSNGWGASSAFDRMNRGFGSPQGNTASQAERQYGAPPSKKESKPAYLPPKSSVVKTVEHVPSADFAASDTSALQEGQRVEHMKFGFGQVTKMEGSAHNPVATVKFDQNGEKKIMLNYAKLRIVE